MDTNTTIMSGRRFHAIGQGMLVLLGPNMRTHYGTLEPEGFRPGSGAPSTSHRFQNIVLGLAAAGQDFPGAHPSVQRACRPPTERYP